MTTLVSSIAFLLRRSDYMLDRADARARAIRKKPCLDDDGPDGARDALTGRCETFDGDGCHHESYRAEIPDPDDHEERHPTETAVAAVEAVFEAPERRVGSAMRRPGAVAGDEVTAPAISRRPPR